jgi:hypothetical protein
MVRGMLARTAAVVGSARVVGAGTVSEFSEELFSTE